MATVNTVLGSVETENLGFTLMHEHLLTAAGGVYRDYPELLGTNLMERMVDVLKKEKEGGVDTIVDATTPDLGRDINLMAEVSRRSGVNIIACAGWWLDIPTFFNNVSADQLAEVFTREIQHGISGTNIKAGILKSASDLEGVTPKAETVLRAVARAHHKTGVPIMLHSYAPARVGQRQLAILKEEGVDLSRVKVDHSNDTTDLEYLLWIREQGCYLGFDRYPGRNVSSLARTKTLKALIDEGCADHICPSHDWPILRIIAGHPERDPYGTEEARQKYNPYGHLYMKEVVFTQLRDMGVSEAILGSLCVDGPRNFFEGV
ncbi:phosphotriesterase [Chloroflexota bacterium]